MKTVMKFILALLGFERKTLPSYGFNLTMAQKERLLNDLRIEPIACDCGHGAYLHKVSQGEAKCLEEGCPCVWRIE